MSNIQRQESGLVSIMVTLVMMIVITLIVIGFTQVTNRNSREALDKQLSTQAFYAAESGINNAITQVNATLTAGGTVAAQTTCAGTGVSLSASPKVEATCVLVNPVVPELTTSASGSASTVILIDPSSAVGGNESLNSLTFTWKSAAGQPTLTNPNCSRVAGQYLPSAGTCGYGLLRVDLMQTDNSSVNVAGANTYNSTTATVFMQPTTAGGLTVVPNFTSTKAYKATALCTGSGQCRATLDISGAGGNKKYFARMTSMYQEIPSITIDGITTSGSSSYFRNAQVLIDSTGKAEDVIRRVQVRYNISGGTDESVPPGGINSSADICKRMTVVGAGNITAGGCTP